MSTNMFVKLMIFGLFLEILLQSISECVHLHGCIQEYDTLNYHPETLQSQHKKHNNLPNHKQTIWLQAYGMILKLRLKKDRSVFTDDYRSIQSNGSLVEHDLSFLYSGHVRGVPDSVCFGSLIKGIFQGSIYLPNETYHVQKSTSFFKEDPGFHSVIYRESDVRCKKNPTAISIGSSEDKQHIPEIVNNRIRNTHHKVTSNQRQKRAVLNLHPRNTCTLCLHSDPLLTARFLQKANGDREVAKQEILATFASHVTAMNIILAKTTFQTFDESISYRGLQLAIKQTLIMPNDDCRVHYYLLKNVSYCDPSVTAMHLLELFSTRNHDMCCLAYLFTDRDFPGGVLGVAWAALPYYSNGGICTKYHEYNHNGEHISKSLNTGIVTTVNYGNELLPRTSYLNFAHQIGHSLGAKHDAGSICVPFGTSRPDSHMGNYIMFGFAISGDLPNNKEYSACSKDRIARTLKHVLNFPERNCLIQNNPICGNEIVDEGEECDCGSTDECSENCCIPRDSVYGSSSDMCKLRPGKMCSPSQGPCCAETCEYIHKGEEKICSLENDCKMAAYCNGSSAVCPKGANKPDETFCGHFTSFCQNGECKSSVCEMIGWKQCFVQWKEDSPFDVCILACMKYTNSSTDNCIASNDDLVDSFKEYKQLVADIRQAMYDAGNVQVPSKGVWLPPGSPCLNYEGYCDAYNRCAPSRL